MIEARLASPRLASPRLASPRLASPRLALAPSCGSLIAVALGFGLAVATVACTEPNPSAGGPCGVDSCGGDGDSSSSAGAMTGPTGADLGGSTTGADTRSGPSGTASSGASDDRGTTGAPTTTGDGPTSVGSTHGGTTGASPSGEGSSSGPGMPQCAAGNVCVDLVPDGWLGPVAVQPRNQGGTTDCDGVYDALEVTAATAVTADAMDCECECGSHVEASCGTSAVLYDYGVGPEDRCASGLARLGSFTLQHGQSREIDADARTRWRVSPVSVRSPGRCTAASVTSEIPEPRRVDEVNLCRGPAAMQHGCDQGQLCVPEPSRESAPLCIWQEGDVSCPSEGGYEERSVYYRSLEDGRACAECVCEPADVRCNGAVWVSGPHRFIVIGGPEQVETRGASVPVDTCNSDFTGIQAGFPDRYTDARLSVAGPTGECRISSHTGPRGELRATSPLTVCCTSES